MLPEGCLKVAVVCIAVNQVDKLFDELRWILHVLLCDVVIKVSKWSVLWEVLVDPYLYDSVLVDRYHWLSDWKVTEHLKKMLKPNQCRQQNVKAFRRRNVLDFWQCDDRILHENLDRIEAATKLIKTESLTSRNDILGLNNIPMILWTPGVKFIHINVVLLSTVQIQWVLACYFACNLVFVYGKTTHLGNVHIGLL